MIIQLSNNGAYLAVAGNPEIICDNADYTAKVETSLTSPVLHLAAEQDGENTEYELPLTDGETTLPTIRNAWGGWLWLSGAELTTERVWLPCRESIKAGSGSVYSAPYDVYNAAVEYANAAHSGTASTEALEAMFAALRDRYEHPPAWPGTAYKRAIAATVRETRLTGKITLPDNTEIPIDDGSIVESTFAISTSAVNGDELLPGGVPSKELSATLRGALPQEQLRGAEIAPVFLLRLESGVWQDIPLGVFTVMQANDDTMRGVPVTAYDDMWKLNNIAPVDCGFAARTGYSPNQIISRICATAGVDYTQNIDFDSRFTGVNTHSCVVAALGVEEAWSWGVVIRNADSIEDVQTELDRLYHGQLTYLGDRDYQSELPADAELLSAYRVFYNGPTYIAAAVGADVETGRDLLMHTLFTVGGFAEIDTNRQLTVKPIMPEHDTEKITENRTHSRSISRLPYKLYSLTMPIEYMTSGGARDIVMHTEETLWGDEYVTAQTVKNALWSHITMESSESQYNAEQAQMNHLVDYLDPVTYSPGRVDMIGDPTICLMNWIAVDDERAMPVTGSVWRYHGLQQLIACGADAVAKAATSQIEKRITGDKIDQAQETQNIMRAIYGQLMQTYLGMQSFKHRDIEHYTYNQLGGGVIT